jgi:chaperonin cofactor prefoldin
MKIETTEKIETLEDELQTLDDCAESDIASINEIKQEIAQLCADSANEE